MAVTMTKAEGITVLTLSSDPQSVCPPLCQIFKSLCYSPVCCSVSQHLRGVQRTSQSVLGSLQIMVGLLNIGIGAILCSMHGVGMYMLRDTAFPFWLGGLFMLFGIVGILSEKYPSPCLVMINVILNLVGVAFAITAIVLYSINMGNIGMWYMCNNRYSDYNWRYGTTTPSPGSDIMMEKCLEGKALILMLVRSMNALMIVLSVMELCLVISSAVLSIKALRRRTSENGENKIGDSELYTPLLETSNPTA
ncbi:membrane-spanning 4-domains subfamily A member 15-like [Cottoperca gobio]|uniref:Membrane-spanning 4-domains subfamily A member 15-like n=1 Tax=Cottoperca gobio TaxID=56716 RepID=A0A6J2RDM9_COTGO|nr:membrane-spanning 4-domains subfamily A member 15-like [Cottoperca gobio]